MRFIKDSKTQKWNCLPLNNSFQPATKMTQVHNLLLQVYNNKWDILLISIPQSQDQKFWEKLIYWNKNYQEQVLTTYLSWINSCSSLIHWFWRIFWSCDRHKTRNSLVFWLLYWNWEIIMSKNPQGTSK